MYVVSYYRFGEYVGQAINLSMNAAEAEVRRYDGRRGWEVFAWEERTGKDIFRSLPYCL